MVARVVVFAGKQNLNWSGEKNLATGFKTDVPYDNQKEKKIKDYFVLISLFFLQQSLLLVFFFFLFFCCGGDE